MRIYLIGYMGCGKSTLGALLAKRLHLTFYDTDSLIEHKYKANIHQLFKRYNEEVFRVIEQGMLTETFSFENAVISTGGGTPCFGKNMELIIENGMSVYLKLSPEHIYQRLKKSRKKRPLLAGLNKKELLDFITGQMALREDFYNKAQIIFDPYKEDIELLIEKFSGIL